jgi:arylsulfatase
LASPAAPPSRPFRALLFAATLALSGCGGTPEPPRHLVLITVDTWRADHFDTERGGTPLTPELARFADAGLRFTSARSVASETAPGIAGILTGLVPRRTGVLANPHVLQREVPALATLLAGAGFATAAVVSNPVLRPASGFDQGFEHYEWVRRRDERKTPGDRVTDAALARVDALALPPERRLFLWVHYLDPHGPYLPPEETRRLFPAAAFEADREVPLLPRGDHTGRGGVPAYQQRGLSPVSRDGRDYLARYAAEVRFMDGEVGRLLEGLTARGILDRAVVVLTADHGEALAGDHGFYFSHGNGLTQDQVDVPLVVRWPGCPAGETVERPVSTLDVVPTVLALLGAPGPRGQLLDGTDLLGDGSPFVYGESRHQVSVEEGEWKAIWRPDGSAALYRLSDDPGELRDRAAEHPDRLAALAARLREVRRREVLAEPLTRGRRSRREEQELRALGYL